MSRAKEKHANSATLERSRWGHFKVRLGHQPDPNQLFTKGLKLAKRRYRSELEANGRAGHAHVARTLFMLDGSEGQLRREVRGEGGGC